MLVIASEVTQSGVSRADLDCCAASPITMTKQCKVIWL
jgi:hypothetical protein